MFRQDFSCPALLVASLVSTPEVSCTGLSPTIAALSRGIPLPLMINQQALPISLATTLGISVDFFSCSYLDVSVRHVRLACLCIQHTMHPVGGFPPFGNLPDQSSFCQLPQLIASYYVLHRLTSPRHPPCALSLVPITLTSFKKHAIELMLSLRVCRIQSKIVLLLEITLHTLIYTITTHQIHLTPHLRLVHF